jgi:hypothetical protein
LEALQFYVAEVDSKCLEAVQTVLVHDKKFLLVDENFRKCSEALNQAVSASTAAFTTASDAKNTVSALNATGSLGQVAALRSTVSELEKTVATQKAELLGVYDLLEKICVHLNGHPSPKPSKALEAQIKSLEGEVKSLRTYTAEQLKIIRQSVDGHGPVKIGSYTFDGVKSCADVLNKMNINTDVIEYLMDPFHILAAILYQARTREDVNTSAILSMKANQSPGKLTAMASYETIQPEIFSGCRTSRTDVTSTANFCAIKTHDLWDSGDGETGVKNFIEHMLIDFVPQFAAQAEQVFGDSHPEFCELAIMLCQRSATALQELSREMSDLFVTLRTKTFGQSSSYTSTQNAEAWNFVLILLQVYCSEMAKPRSMGRNLNSYQDVKTANALALCANVGALGVHARFKSFQFREHPRIFPKLQSYTLQKCLRKSDVEALESDVKKAHTIATRTETDLKSLKRTYDTHIQAYTQFKGKVEASVDLGAQGKKKKPNRRKPQGDGDTPGDADD